MVQTAKAWYDNQTTYKKVIVKGFFIKRHNKDRNWLFQLILKEHGTQAWCWNYQHESVHNMISIPRYGRLKSVILAEAANMNKRSHRSHDLILQKHILTSQNTISYCRNQGKFCLSLKRLQGELGYTNLISFLLHAVPFQ